VTGSGKHLDEHNTPDTGLPAPSRASEGFRGVSAAIAASSRTELLQPREILRRLGAGRDRHIRCVL